LIACSNAPFPRRTLVNVKKENENTREPPEETDIFLPGII
jgi:hypothetical protein